MLRDKKWCFAMLITAFAVEGHAESPRVVQFSPFLNAGLVMTAEINGKTGSFLFDTGAGVTTVTPQFASAIGCRVWGQISGFSMTGQRLDMQRCDEMRVQIRAAGFESGPQTIGVFDVNQMMPPSAPRLDGTIALDVFAGQCIALSYSAKTLRLMEAQDVPKGGAMPVHLVRDAEGLALSVNVPVTTSRGTAWFEIDSGNVTPFTAIAKPYAEPFALDANAKGPQKTELRLADGNTFASDARVMEITLDGNLGVRFLSKYDVTLDLGHGRVWLSPSERQNP